MAIQLLAEALTLVTAPYDKLDGLLERADALAGAAAQRGLDRVVALARLARADVLNRTGQLSEGVRLTHEVLAGAVDAGDDLVTARANALLATGLYRLGAWAESVGYAETSVRLLDASAPLEIQVDHALIVAMLTSMRAGKLTTSFYEHADELARRLGDPVMIVANLNNLAWSQYECGDIDGAAVSVTELCAVAARHGHDLNASVLDTVAMVLLESGAPDEAERLLSRALAGQVAVTDADSVVAVLLTYSEIKLRAGDHDDALRLVRESQRLIGGRRLGDSSACALRQLAAIRAAMGDFRAAYQAMVDFQLEWEELRSRQGEATTSVLQVLFDVEQARRDSERFQELAERDALTGLWNRRHLDRRLPALLERAGQSGAPLAVALLDLDHFKQINDRFSHDTGDEVLRAVAGLLPHATAVFSVRLGGEEFLAVFDGWDGTAVLDQCERLRQSIAEYPWARYDANLVVTTSIGVTSAVAGDTVSSLLRRADEHLYCSKRTGRDRVTGDTAERGQRRPAFLHTSTTGGGRP
jgi:diguanylate cyclase (GGDEF)-like protein